MATSARSVSSEMPRHTESSFDHFVTQWMSLTTSSWGRCVSSDQDHVFSAPPSAVIENDHVDRSARGVGPADSTGKPRSRYWPGGMRGSVSRLPRKPREMIAMPGSQVVGRSHHEPPTCGYARGRPDESDRPLEGLSRASRR